MKLSEYESEWMFTDKDLPVSSEDRNKIEPLGEIESAKLWTERISSSARHPAEISDTDWEKLFPFKSERMPWHEEWNSGSMDLPECLNQIEWGELEVVYFAFGRLDIIRTNWSVFQRNWKCFLFHDEGPLLFSESGTGIVSFGADGKYIIGRNCQ